MYKCVIILLYFVYMKDTLYWFKCSKDTDTILNLRLNFKNYIRTCASIITKAIILI